MELRKGSIRDWLCGSDVLVSKYTNHLSNIIVPKYGYQTHKDYVINY